MNFFRRLLGSSEAKDVESKLAPASKAETADMNTPTAEVPASPVQPSQGTRPEITFPYGDGATRPLNEEVLLNFLTPKHVSFGQITDTGSVRTNNQDSAFSFFSTTRSVEERPDFGLFILADGMGGHLDGEKASAIAVKTVAKKILGSVYLKMVEGDTDSQPPIAEALIDSIESANDQVHAAIPDGGTTLTTVILFNNLAYVAHVGDSRLYLISKGGIEQLTRDHSLVQRLIELDQLTPEEAADHPQKHVLYRALGQNETIEVDTLTRRLPAQSRLLLCSDGLWGLVEESDLVEIVTQSAQPQDACQKLISLANKRGGIDNITAILIYMPD